MKVQLRNGKYPEIWLNNQWSPICGHYFWSNDYGATLFCQNLNSTHTYGIATKKDSAIPLTSDGIRVGACKSQDSSLSSCTGGCNDFGQTGGYCSDKKPMGGCGVGKKAMFEIECDPGINRFFSFIREYFTNYLHDS